MPALRPSTYLILGLLLLLAWQLRTVLVPVAVTVVPWVIAQPAAVLLLLLATLCHRATRPTIPVRNR